MSPRSRLPHSHVDLHYHRCIYIRNNLLLPLINEGKDVILVAHSYSGMPSAAAAVGLSKAERTAAGQPGGIIGLIWVAAIIAHPGDSLKTLMGGQFGSWCVIDVRSPRLFLPSTSPSLPTVQDTSGNLRGEDPKAIFYGDVAQPIAISQLKPQLKNVLSTPSGAQAWGGACYDGRRAYIHTLFDLCIPTSAQSGMVAGSAVAWDVHSFRTAHSPFMLYPAQLSQTYISLARQWQ
ncbi:hypothetical protein MMC32_001449 [Xylographa parallela]|nr:hypothetical protein [Xylographa parallela]